MIKKYDIKFLKELSKLNLVIVHMEVKHPPFPKIVGQEYIPFDDLGFILKFKFPAFDTKGQPIDVKILNLMDKWAKEAKKEEDY